MLSTLRSPALRGMRSFNAPSFTSRVAFSTTPRYNVNALFKMTENEELNTVLHEIQDKIILPSYLPELQRRIVFDPKKKQFLETNPIDIEVEGFEHRFKHINPHKDIPKTKTITDQAIAAMKTREDFDNVGTLLAGLQHAGQGLNASRTSGLIRSLTKSRQIGALVGALKQHRQTGLVIPTKEALLHILSGLTRQVEEAKGNLEEIRQLVNWLDIVQDVIQRPEHKAHITPVHQNVANYARSKFANVNAEVQKEISPIFSVHGNTDLINSVFGRSMALYPRLALVKAKQEAGEDVEADMVKINDEIEALTHLWHERQPKDVEIFDMDRVVETKQACPSMNPRGNLWKWHKNTTLSDLSYLQILARTYAALKEAELMSPAQAQGLTAVANQIPSHAAKLLQIMMAKDLQIETKVANFKKDCGIDLGAILATLPPLENHRIEFGIDPSLYVSQPEAELEEGAAAEEEAQPAGSEAR